MYRDNTKSKTPSLSGGSNKTVRMGNPRPGRGQKKPMGAGEVRSVNGMTPRPGYKQFKPAGGGFGSIARPGGNQKIKG